MILNIEQRVFLNHLHAGNVYRSESGRSFVERQRGDTRPCDRMLRTFTDAVPPLAVLGADGRVYKLTDAGRELRGGGSS